MHELDGGGASTVALSRYFSSFSLPDWGGVAGFFLLSASEELIWLLLLRFLLGILARRDKSEAYRSR